MPTFRVTAPDGTVTTYATYRAAMVARAMAGGGTLTVDAP
jgi:hypothetical protein